MKWIVIDTIIQPSCGISFSAIWGNMKMIIWYQSTIFLPPGSIFTPVKSGIILKDKEYPITIYNIAPFNKDLWSLLKRVLYKYARYAINNTYINKTTGVLYARCNIKHM